MAKANKAARPEATSWSSIQVEAAMCLWDTISTAWLDFYDKAAEAPLPTAPEWFIEMHKAWDGNGSLGMMHAVRHVAIDIEAMWEALPEALTNFIVYDWEFIPEVVRWIDWAALDHHQIATLKPDAEAGMIAWCMVQQERHKVAYWWQMARDRADFIYGFRGMVEENKEYFDREIAEGVEPEQAVRNFGEAYDLNAVVRDDKGRIMY